MKVQGDRKSIFSAIERGIKESVGIDTFEEVDVVEVYEATPSDINDEPRVLSIEEEESIHYTVGVKKDTSNVILDEFSIIPTEDEDTQEDDGIDLDELDEDEDEGTSNEVTSSVSNPFANLLDMSAKNLATDEEDSDDDSDEDAEDNEFVFSDDDSGEDEDEDEDAEESDSEEDFIFSDDDSGEDEDEDDESDFEEEFVFSDEDDEDEDDESDSEEEFIFSDEDDEEEDSNDFEFVDDDSDDEEDSDSDGEFIFSDDDSGEDDDEDDLIEEEDTGVFDVPSEFKGIFGDDVVSKDTNRSNDSSPKRLETDTLNDSGDSYISPKSLDAHLDESDVQSESVGHEKQTVEEVSKSLDGSNVIFERGMTMVEFLRKNPTIRGEKELLSYFNEAEIQSNLKFGRIFLKHGRVSL